MRHSSQEKGLTIIEVVVATFILMILVVILFSAFKDNFALSRRTHESLVAQQDLQILGRKFAAEVRAAAPSESGGFAIGSVSTSSFMFYTDADNDGIAERVRYFLDGDTFVRGVLVPSGSPLAYTGTEMKRALVQNVIATTTPVFQYYDTTYTGTSSPLSVPFDPSAIRLVQLTLVVDADTRLPPDPVVSTTQVSIRTLKDNL